MTLILTYDLDLQSLANYVSSHMQKFEIKGQSVPKIEWKQMHGQADGGDCVTSLANAGYENFAPGSEHGRCNLEYGQF